MYVRCALCYRKPKFIVISINKVRACVHIITALGVIKKMCIHTHTYVRMYTHMHNTPVCVTACYCGRFSGIIISNWVDRFASMSSSSHIKASVLPLSLS